MAIGLAHRPRDWKVISKRRPAKTGAFVILSALHFLKISEEHEIEYSSLCEGDSGQFGHD